MRWMTFLVIWTLLGGGFFSQTVAQRYTKFDFREGTEEKVAPTPDSDAETNTDVEDAMAAGAGRPEKKKGVQGAKKVTSSRKTAKKSKKKSEDKSAKSVAAKPQEDTKKDRDPIEKMQILKLENMKKAYPENPLIYYESVHFFYLTDAPQKIAVECIQYLEDAYQKLQMIFQLPLDQRVWHGKCMVVAFVNQNTFMQFETKFFDTPKSFLQADGLAHLMADGNVLVSTHYGDIAKEAKRWLFLATLVHETTHGFMHRYKSQASLPLWLDEGIADYIAGLLVPDSPSFQSKQKSALKYMRTTNSVGGMFVETKQLKVWQYGAASGLVGFLVKTNPKSFSQMFEGIKAGKKWTDALQESYHCTPEELLLRFGQANNIPTLSF